LSNPFFMPNIHYDSIQNLRQIEEILHLQQINLPQNISLQEKQSQGFVTIEHDFDLLLKMNKVSPHIIALDQEKVIGFALVMLGSFREEIEILKPMFHRIDKNFSNLSVPKTYFVMGQVCIAKEYRGQGIFKGLYDKMKEVMSPRYDCCITEVDPENIRSIKAHDKQGFKRLELYSDHTGRFWELIIWNWK